MTFAYFCPYPSGGLLFGMTPVYPPEIKHGNGKASIDRELSHWIIKTSVSGECSSPVGLAKVCDFPSHLPVSGRITRPNTSLVGGLEHFLFSHILGMSSSQLTFIFFRGFPQPPTSSGWWNISQASHIPWNTTPWRRSHEMIDHFLDSFATFRS